MPGGNFPPDCNRIRPGSGRGSSRERCGRVFVRDGRVAASTESIWTDDLLLAAVAPPQIRGGGMTGVDDLPVIGGRGQRASPGSTTNVCSSEYQSPSTSDAGAGSPACRT